MKQRARARVDEPVERGFFRQGWNYTKTLLRLSRDIASAVDVESLSKGLVQTLGEVFESERVSLFLSDEVERTYVLKAAVGWSSERSQGLLLPRDNFLVQALLESPHPIVKRDLDLSSERQQEKVVGGKTARLGMEVSFPLRVRGKLTGILNLVLRKDRANFSDENLEFLSVVANQAAIGLENMRLCDNLKQSQNIIRRADRLSSLGQLTAGFAHEIRNTLVAVRTFTQLLPERYADPDFRDNFQSLALKEVDRICSLVTDLLSFARPSVPNVSAENINEIVESIVRLLETQAKEKGIQIHRSLAAGLPRIFIDKEQIKQVFMNIILNALQSVEGEGVVEVSTRLFTKNEPDQYVQIEVRDTGVGIPEKDLDNIFNPFFTRKEEGSGLGLSISHQIVQGHGGYIAVESRVGAGTTFYVNLPVNDPDHRGEKSPLSA